MLTRFRVSNFKNLMSVGFEPQPLSVLIGPNGAGKSSLLQSLDFLRAFFMTSVEVYLQERGWEYKDLPNLRQTSKTIRWEVSAQLPPDERGNCAGTYDYSISLSPRRYLAIGRERLDYSPAEGEPVTLLSRKGRAVDLLNRATGERSRESYFATPASVMSTFDPSRERKRYPELLHFRQWVEGFKYFLLWDPKVLRSPDRGKHLELGSSGEHLAPFLALLKNQDEAAFGRLLRRVRRIFPHVSDISVTGGRQWGWRTIRAHERDNGHDVAFNSQQMSDGVLRLLAVTSMVYAQRVPSLIMFEEPEDGVHPQLIREVVQVLRELTLRKPPNECQVIFTTHSPYVLDQFYDSPDEVFIMERLRPQEGASLTQLSSATHLAEARRVFEGSLGEAWFSGLIGGTAGVKAR